MIKSALLYEQELNKIWANCWYDDKYKYFRPSPERDPLTVKSSTWDSMQYVCVDHNDNVTGYISYIPFRDLRNYAKSLIIVNFSGSPLQFGVDLKKVIDELFTKFNFCKLNFAVVVGNPIEKTYDKLVKRYNGRIVGTFEKDVVLLDGCAYDLKHYELTRDNYIKSKESK